MLDQVKQNYIFYLILASIPLIFSVIGQTVSVLIVVLALTFIFQKKGDLLLILFWFILILSDNYGFTFATSIKPVLITMVFGYAVFNLRVYYKENVVFKKFIPFFILALFLLVLSPSLLMSTQKYLSYVLVAYSIPLIVASEFRKSSNLFLMKLTTFLFLVVLANLTYAQFSIGAYSHGGRLTGLFGNPNGLAMFSLFTLLFFDVSRSLINFKISRNETIVFYFILLSCLILTGSRAALLSYILFFIFKRLSKSSPVIGFVVLAFIAFGYDFVVSLGYQFVESVGLSKELRLEGDQGITSGSGRLIAWKYAWIEIQKSFFFGRGWAYDEIWIYGPIQGILNLLNHQGGVHNVYLILWLNNGIVGLLLFLGGLITIFLKVSRNTFLAFPVLYAALFQANFEPWLAASLNPYTICFFTIITIMIVGEFKVDKKLNSE